MTRVALCILVMGFGIVLSAPVHAQQGETPAPSSSEDAALLDMSLEDLLDMPVTVASGSVKKKASESPGIITVITAEDIARLGSRDLIDVLRTVPGISPEYDLAGLIGIGMRGMWANEGKVLILVDGHEVNEELFGTYYLDHRFPLSIIDRIEIIRGPGSVMYGGAAELGVISIHTKRPTEKHAVLYHGGAGVMFDDQDATLGRALGTAYYGGLYDNVRFDVSVSGQTGHSSNQEMTNPSGDTWNVADDSISDVFINGNLKVYGFELKVLFDRYDLEYTYPEYDLNDFASGHYDFLTSASYTFEPTDRLTITPTFRYKNQMPWNTPSATTSTGEHVTDMEYDQLVQRFTFDLNASWNVIDPLNLTGGVAYDYYMGTDLAEVGAFGGENKVGYHNVAAYLQALGTSKIVDYAAGVRFNYHEAAGASFVPRLALTRSFLRDYHVKLLAAMAYKAPTMYNIAYTPEIAPERANTLELELGGNWGGIASLCANVFFNQMRDVIVYYVLPSGTEDGYKNGGELSTMGVESTGRITSKYVGFSLSYAYFYLLNSDVEDFVVPGETGNTLGFASHKITSSLPINPFDQFYLTPSLVFLSPRHGIDEITYDADDNETMHYAEIPAEVLLDFTVLYQNVVTAGLDLSLSFHNILGQDAKFVQPYLGYEAPYPGPGREVMLRLTYSNF